MQEEEDNCEEQAIDTPDMESLEISEYGKKFSAARIERLQPLIEIE